MSIAVAGFLLGLSLIVAIGPQNALVIRQGVKREGLIVVLAICMLSDIFLIFGGTAGVGVIIEKAPLALVALKWFGAAYLAWFAVSCFRDMVKPRALDSSATDDGTSLDDAPTAAHVSNVDTTSGNGGQVQTKTRPITTTAPTRQAHPARPWVKPALAALAFTWLNPSAYIDTLVMLGGIANQHGESGRWVFAAGALMASAVWFPLLGFFSTRFSRVLSRPQAWRVITGVIGCIMVVMCIRLVMH